MMKFGKTAAYTILKNERQYIDKWLYYTQFYDYRVLLDTGSTDGSWEYLQERAKTDPGLIIEQKTWTPWRFDLPRIHNLAMVPQDVAWCLSPDLDEYYSINTLQTMEALIADIPTVTCIASDRLDIYSDVVRVGPPQMLPTNKIHRRQDYSWKARVYEHLTWIHQDRFENEVYCNSIYLIHDQDFRKPERSPLYAQLLEEGWDEDPTDNWNNWFLLKHYYRERNFVKYLPVACKYVLCEKKPSNSMREVYADLQNIYQKMTLDDESKAMIVQSLQKGSHTIATGGS